ncbi:hypothetical protein B0H17DRAFT_1143443 [Mycena rosella]|uniref:Uncharacterized protein n=1 Tax=Mycena rosella TaxID=1033263 RepID=A0AAD7CUW0_MYCRO|nr:hypothetical protein B0H17DRAFT_1143443 [Mycena rosella]
MCVGIGSEYLEISHECGITPRPWYTPQERHDLGTRLKQARGTTLGLGWYLVWSMNQNKYREQDRRVRTIKYDLGHVHGSRRANCGACTVHVIWLLWMLDDIPPIRRRYDLDSVGSGGTEWPAQHCSPGLWQQ